MLARMRALDPFKADLLLAAVFLVEANIELAVLVPADAPHRWGAELLILVAAFTLAIRRRWPSIAALLGVPVQAVAQLLGDAYVDHLVSPFFVILIVLYGIGRHTEGWKVPALSAYSVAAFWVSLAVDNVHDTVADYVLIAVLLVGAPVLIGRVLRHRAGLNQALLAKRERLDRKAHV